MSTQSGQSQPAMTVIPTIGGANLPSSSMYPQLSAAISAMSSSSGNSSPTTTGGVAIPNLSGAMNRGPTSVVNGMRATRNDPIAYTRIEGITNSIFKIKDAVVPQEDMEIAKALDRYCVSYTEADISKCVEFRGLRFQLKNDETVVGEVIACLFGSSSSEVNAWRTDPKNLWNIYRTPPGGKTIAGHPYQVIPQSTGVSKYRMAWVGHTCLSIVKKCHPELWAVTPAGILRCAVMTLVNGINPVLGFGAASQIQYYDDATKTWVRLHAGTVQDVELAEGMPEAKPRRTRRVKIYLV